MVKRQKEDTPNINATPNCDIIQRLNFLCQASVYLQSLEPPSRSRSKGKGQRKGTTRDLARSYVQCMRAVGQKTTVKIDPTLKRSLCSTCNTTLIPGSSASVRVRKSLSHGHLVIYTCLHCKSSKSIPAPPTLPLNLAAGTEECEGSLNAPSTVLETPESSDKSSPLTVAPQSQSRAPKKGKRSILLPRSRPLPLFARLDAGHVVFRGNQVLNQQGGVPSKGL